LTPQSFEEGVVVVETGIDFFDGTKDAAFLGFGGITMAGPRVVAVGIIQETTAVNGSVLDIGIFAQIGTPVFVRDMFYRQRKAKAAGYKNIKNRPLLGRALVFYMGQRVGG